VWLALLACLGGLALLPWARRRHPPLSFFLAFFAIAFLPVSNLLFPIGTILAERLLYLPSVGLVGAVAVVLSALARRIPDGNDARFRALVATTGLVIVVLGIRTFRRNQDWRDELSLWTSAAQASPNSYKVHVGRSLALLRSPQGQERLGEVIEILERGRAIVESQGLPAKYRPLSLYHNLGVSYLNQARAHHQSDPAAARRGYERAADVLTKTIAIEDTLVLSTPEERATHALLLATALLGLDRPVEALEHIDRALALRPDDPNAYEARARALVQQGRFEDAAISVDTAIVLGVDTPSLWSLAKEIYDRLAPREPALVEEHGQTLLARGHPMVNAHLLAASRELARRLVAHGERDKALRVRDIAASRLEVAPAAFDDVLAPASR
jgi:tetratricopeptide (TPR) repeat protein